MLAHAMWYQQDEDQRAPVEEEGSHEWIMSIELDYNNCESE